MTFRLSLLSTGLLFAVLFGCDGAARSGLSGGMTGPGAAEADERGPHNGRLLRDEDFAVELAVYETGLPPEFRAWITDAGRPVHPAGVDLGVRLTRLGGRVDDIRFRPQDDYLRGDAVVYEPHSFVVSVTATYEGETYQWEYDSFEGRTSISPEMAQAFGLETMIAGPAVLTETVTLYGRIAPSADGVREVNARFEGAIRSVAVSLGETVAAGQTLATIESNESLSAYTIEAPIAGVVTDRTANAGEQTAGRVLFRIVDTSSLWAELDVFSTDRSRVRIGSDARIASVGGDTSAAGTVSHVGVLADRQQAVSARVVLDNSDGRWTPGMYVTGEIEVAATEVPLAVKRSALQSFRDFTVVFARFDDQYEVRMLDLGRQTPEWAEVLGGLDPGTRYVVENSYVLKADVEKSGASHDH